nr:glycosyltransferase family 39 protein [Chloroflexota bacterium]
MPGTSSIIWFVAVAVILFWFGRYAWQYWQGRRNPGDPAPLATGDKLYDAYTAALEKIKSRWMSARAAPAKAAPPPAPEAATPDPVAASSPVPEPPLIPSAAQQTSIATVTHTGQVFLPDQPGMRRISHVQISLDIAEGSSVHVVVESAPGSDAPVVQHFVSPYPGEAVAAPAAKPADAARPPVWRANNAWRTQVSAAAATVSAALTRAGAALASRHISLEWALFGIGLVVYLITRLWSLDKFPIYFFADEASNSLFAQDLIARGFRDAKGSWLPIYFDAAANRWTPLLSVYVHAISVGLFGKSIIVARVTSALVSLLAVVAVSLILKRVFKARFWWVGALLLAVTPAWFLHSRTAFETVMMVSFYACFLLCYMLYRTESPRYAYGALLFGAAAFYTYSNGQVVVAALAVMLLVSDFRYHAQQWRKLLPAMGLAVGLALPAIIFRFSHPTAAQDHLHTINSFLFQDVSIRQKIVYLVQTYLYGLNPAYWFFPNNHDLVRHIMKGYGHINTQFLPFAALGLGI